MIARDVYQKYRLPFLLSFSLCFLMFMPLIINGQYYIDDLGRSIRAEPAWARNGRPVADYVTWALNFGGKIQDISPLSQLLGVAILSSFSLLVARKYLGSLSPLSILVASSSLMSPFLMENMAFEYDAFPMFLSFIIAAAPFLLIGVKRSSLFAACCFISVFVSLNLYQASLCVFFVFAILNFLNHVRVGRNNIAFRDSLIACVAMIFAYAIYSKFVVPHVISGDYNIAKSQAVPLSDPHQALLIIIYNASLFRDLILSAISPAYVIAITPVAVAFIFSLYKLMTNINRNALWLPSVAIVTLSPLMLAFFIVGPMLFLGSPLFRPRVMMGFSAFLVAMSVVASWCIPKRVSSAKVYLLIPILYIISMNYTFFNALSNQQDYERFVISHIVTDAYGSDVQNTNKIMFNGWIGLSPVVKVAISKYPSLDILVTRLLHDDNGWGWIQLQHYGMNKPFPDGASFKKAKSELCSSKFIKESNYYNVYKNGDLVIMDFDKKCHNQ